MKKRKIFLLTLALWSSIFFTLIYMAARTLFVVIADYYWYEKIIGITLLLAEIFILIHGIGYIMDIVKVTSKKLSHENIKIRPNLISHVAVIIPSFKEPLDILEDTLTACYNMTYENKYIFLLDDTKYEENTKELQKYKKQIDELCKKWNIGLFRRNWRGAKAGIINDFLSLITGDKKEGFILEEFGKKAPLEEIKYITIFDADQNPFIDFLEPLVSQMEGNKKLAFVQTPQYYTNFEENNIAAAAGLQQSIFYEFICEGKSISDSMYCCGTNVIFRVKALLDVDGFDEESVTEDFATSLKFHLRGWSTKYYGKVGAFGMAPADLGNYFKQQYRWSLGTLGLLKKIAYEFFKNPKKMEMVKWWEYFLSGSYYLIGIVLFLFMVYPIIFLFFTVPTYFIDLKVYATIFMPYFILATFIFFGTLRNRGYAVKDLLFSQLLLTINFPVFIKSTVDAALGKKKGFEITSKGETASLPLRALWPQLAMAVLCFTAVIWGINRMIYERSLIVAIAANVFWSFYHFAILSTVFIFNKPQLRRAVS